MNLLLSCCALSMVYNLGSIANPNNEKWICVVLEIWKMIGKIFLLLMIQNHLSMIICLQNVVGC